MSACLYVYLPHLVKTIEILPAWVCSLAFLHVIESAYMSRLSVRQVCSNIILEVCLKCVSTHSLGDFFSYLHIYQLIGSEETLCWVKMWCSFTWPDKFLSYVSCAVMSLLEISLTFSYLSCVKFTIYILPHFFTAFLSSLELPFESFATSLS
jgi:hypothetical protein